MTPHWKDYRDHVDTLVRAALDTADPGEAVRRGFAQRNDQKALDDYRHVWLVGCGKASMAMGHAALEQLGDRVAGGALCVPPGQEGADLAPLILYPAAHPLPDERNLAGATAIGEVARNSSAGDLLVCLISGGGSAHLMLPAEGLSLDNLRAVTQALLLGGAPIEHLNAVRKHCEQLKGGGLARLTAPANVWALILSDVVGDRLDVIASGPTSPDPTTYAEALSVLERYNALNASAAVTAHLQAGARGERPETVKPGDEALHGVENTIVGTNTLAVSAAAEAAVGLGFAAESVETPIEGEAREVARQIAGGLAEGTAPDPPFAVVFGGETTVTVHGEGKGGRNQELALAAALEIEGREGVVIASFATDGIDGPTDAAGAIVTGQTCQRAREMGLDPRAYLDDNDSHTFFDQLGDLVTTGTTGTNVNDLAFVLVY